MPVVTRHGSAVDARLLAWSGERDEDQPDLDPGAVREFAALQCGTELLGGCWPEGSAPVATDICAVAAPVGHRGSLPPYVSIHGLSGFVMTSVRPAYTVAPTPVHETMQQRFGGILDRVSVVPKPRIAHYLPLVGARLAQGCQAAVDTLGDV